jgi:carboxylate-amine ligase
VVQTIAHLELEEGYHSERLIHAFEILQENRFLAARDGMDARLIDAVAEQRVPALEQLEELVDAGLPHAQELGCEDAFERVGELALDTGAAWQRSVAGGSGLGGVVEHLAGLFAA